MMLTVVFPPVSLLQVKRRLSATLTADSGTDNQMTISVEGDGETQRPVVL